MPVVGAVEGWWVGEGLPWIVRREEEATLRRAIARMAIVAAAPAVAAAQRLVHFAAMV